MAQTEFRTIISVNTGESVKSIKDLKDNIKFLKKELEETDIASEEYQKTLKELEVNQTALKDATRTNAKSFDELEQKTNGVGQSYDALRNRLAKLTKEWHSVDKALEPDKWQDMALEINKTRDELKDMDAHVGNFQRNVGDYKNQMVQAFMATAGSAGSMITPINGATNALKVMSATPVIAILGLLAQVIQKVIEGFSTSEENVFALKKAFSVFEPIADAVTNTMQRMAKGIIWVVEKLGDFAKLLGLIDKASEEHQQISEREIELTKKERQARMQQADDELKVAQLKEKATDKLKYTHQERIGFLKEAMALEEGISKRNVELAKEEYEILQTKAKWTGNDAQTNDELADSYVRLQEAEKAYFDKKKELNSQLVEATNAMKAELAKNAETEDEIETERRKLPELQKVQEEKITLLQTTAEQTWSIEQGLHQREMQMEEEKRKEAEKTAEYRKQVAMASLDTMAGIFGALANLMEGDEKKNAKNAGKIKALRIAEATISTIQGAIQAYNSAQSIPPPAGPIIGGVNAGIVTATGVANIAKIKSVPIRGGEGGATLSPSIPAPRSSAPIAPAIRTITGASGEDRLNQSLQDQRVYILESDIRKSGKKVEIRDQETNF